MKKSIFCLGVFAAGLFTTALAQSWSVNGNSGTNPPTHFIGTTDNKGLVFKTSNAERLRIGPGGNVGIGTTGPLQKLDVNGNINIRKGFALFMENHPVLKVDSINGNTFLGNGSGSRVAGGANTGIGYQALLSNTSGSWNTALGFQSLQANSVGSDNVAVGYLTLNNNNSASGNTAIGNYALLLNNGNYNTATGSGALFSNTSGIANVATGRNALITNSTGNYNTANGTEALNKSTSSYNTATGYRALYLAGSGYENTAHGAQALYSNSTGVENTAVGTNALYSATGNYNTAVGDYALYNTTGAWGNTAVGDIAGAAFHNGYYNTFIGAETDATAADIFNSTALGRSAVVTAASQVRIGNSFVNSIGGFANWSNISDGRVKKNIKQNVPGLSFINKLKPVTYNLDLDAADRITGRPAVKNKDGRLLTKQASQSDIAARNTKQQMVYTGFVAQEVEKAAKELNYDFSGVDAAKNDKDLYALRYAEFVVPLVKAVQELAKENDELKSRLGKLEAMVNGSALLSSGSQQSISMPAASLEQNSPNPFSGTTTINYTLPRKFSSAKIVITDKEGRVIRDMKVAGSGKNNLTVDASALSSGTYQYSLYVDGKCMGTKQMVCLQY